MERTNGKSFPIICNLDSYQLKQLLFRLSSNRDYNWSEVGDMAEQRNNQSEFSFELEELSSKFAGLKEPVKKV